MEENKIKNNARDLTAIERTNRMEDTIGEGNSEYLQGSMEKREYDIPKSTTLASVQNKPNLEINIRDYSKERAESSVSSGTARDVDRKIRVYAENSDKNNARTSGNTVHSVTEDRKSHLKRLREAVRVIQEEIDHIELLSEKVS